MRVLVSISIGVVHAVHNTISLWTKEGCPLEYPAQNVEKLLPSFSHGKHTVGRISMTEKGLRKERKIPMGNEKYQYYHICVKTLQRYALF